MALCTSLSQLTRWWRWTYTQPMNGLRVPCNSNRFICWSASPNWARGCRNKPVGRKYFCGSAENRGVRPVREYARNFLLMHKMFSTDEGLVDGGWGLASAHHFSSPGIVAILWLGDSAATWATSCLKYWCYWVYSIDPFSFFEHGTTVTLGAPFEMFASTKDGKVFWYPSFSQFESNRRSRFAIVWRYRHLIRTVQLSPSRSGAEWTGRAWFSSIAGSHIGGDDGSVKPPGSVYDAI